MIPITDRIAQFLSAIEKYLQINDAYRAAGIRNPTRREELKKLRAAAYHLAQTANADLHTHLAQYTQPDILHDHARELIRRWDARNTCYNNLRQLTPDDHPTEARNRLNRSERQLRAQLEKLKTLLQKIATN